MIRTAITTVLCLSAALHAAPDRFADTVPRRVLYIGNSYTYTNMGIHEATRLAGRYASPADTIEVVARVIGGSSLEEHWGTVTPDRIREGGWDIVVLQERSTGTLTDSSRELFFTYARLFDALIDSVGARTAFFMTWPREGQDTWEVISTSYDSIGTELGAIVVPVGTMVEHVRNNRTNITTYSADGSHPSVPGTWAAGLMFHCSFTGKNPLDNAWNPDSAAYPDDVAAYVRGAAWNVMRDFRETPCTDSSAPSVPSGLAGEAVSTSSVRITWDTSSHAACGVRRYRVFRDGSYAGDTFEPRFVDSNLLGGTGYDYTVTAVSLAGVESPASAAVTATTLLDSVPPELVEALDTRKPTRVILRFDEPLDTVTAETPGNYAISGGITVTAAALDNDVVTLTTSAMEPDVVYTVTVSGVMDNASVGNTIAAGAEKSFSYIPLSYMDGCVGYWPFDNSAEDYAPAGNNASWTGDPSYASAGRLKQCLSQYGDTVSSYVTIPRSDSLDGMDALTVSVWARKNDAATGGYLLLMHTAYRLILGGNSVSGYLYTTTDNVNFSTTVESMNDTGWHHYCLSYDGAALVTYVDAVPVDTDPLTGAVADVSRDLTVGKLPWGSKLTFNGRIDELRIYDTALDSAGVAALFTDEPYADAAMDSAAVRALLDRNNSGLLITDVARRDPATGRVTGLYLDSLGFMDRLTDHIGQLTAMRVLTCAAGPDFDTSLVYVDPAVGNCTALETLVLAHNALTSLPDEIADLTGLTLLDMGYNMLCDVQEPVKTWLDTYDPDWTDTQTGCTGIMVRGPAKDGTDGAFIVTQAEGRVTVRYAGSDDAGVRILAVDGTLMHDGTFINGAVTWLPRTAGVYVMELRDGNETDAVKIVVW